MEEKDEELDSTALESSEEDSAQPSSTVLEESDSETEQIVDIREEALEESSTVVEDVGEESEELPGSEIETVGEIESEIENESLEAESETLEEASEMPVIYSIEVDNANDYFPLYDTYEEFMASPLYVTRYEYEILNKLEFIQYALVLLIALIFLLIFRKK